MLPRWRRVSSPSGLALVIPNTQDHIAQALQLLNTTLPMSSLQYFVGYPFQLYGSKSVDNALTFGGVTTVVR